MSKPGWMGGGSLRTGGPARPSKTDDQKVFTVESGPDGPRVFHDKPGSTDRPLKVGLGEAMKTRKGR